MLEGTWTYHVDYLNRWNILAKIKPKTDRVYEWIYWMSTICDNNFEHLAGDVDLAMTHSFRGEIVDTNTSVIFYVSSFNITIHLPIVEGKIHEDVRWAMDNGNLDFMVDDIEWSCPIPSRNRENIIRIRERAFLALLQLMLRFKIEKLRKLIWTKISVLEVHETFSFYVSNELSDNEI